MEDNEGDREALRRPMGSIEMAGRGLGGDEFRRFGE